MKIVLPGGTGQLGHILTRSLSDCGHEVVILSRSPSSAFKSIFWDGRTLGPWTKEIDGADAVINLAGRSVNCRYTKSNLEQMMSSRVDSTEAVGKAIEQASRPPRIWLQMSTATIYAHRFDAPNDETTGFIGGEEPSVPAYWKFSVDIALAWERALREANTPKTRKVALRTAIAMSPDSGGALDLLIRLTRLGLGGSIGGGRQFVSWIHDHDFVRAIQFILEQENISGAINLSSPNPIPQREFMMTLRKACGISIGLPATKWMAEIGAFFLRSDTELLLKSRRVIPTTLLNTGFKFRFPNWTEAAQELVKRRKAPVME